MCVCVEGGCRQSISLWWWCFGVRARVHSVIVLDAVRVDAVEEGPGGGRVGVGGDKHARGRGGGLGNSPDADVHVRLAAAVGPHEPRVAANDAITADNPDGVS